MILCLLLGIQPLQTQKLPSRAANGPGFAVLAEARTLRENEAYEAAFHKAMEAVRISKEAGNLETWGDSFEEAFQCAFHCEDIDLYPPLMEALKDASAQLANLQQVPPKTQAVIWGRMGTVHHASGAYNQAFEWYEKALPYSEQSGDSSLTMRLYANAGTLIWDQGDDFRALNYLEKSLTLATALEDTVMMGRITTSLGNVYRMIEPEKSVAVFQRAIALQPNNSLAHVLLSKAYLETKKDVAKARETALVSLQLAEDEAEKADAFHQLGRVFFEEKNYPKALEYYDRAIQFGLPGYGKNSPEYIKIHVFKGDVYLAQQQFSKADAAYRQTLIELLPLFRPSNPNQLPVLDELTTISPWILDALLGQAKTRKAQYRQTNDPENLKSALSAYELAIAYQNRIKLRFADDLSKFQFNSYYNTTCESALQIAFELYRMFQTPEYAARAFSLSEQTKAVVLAEGLYKRQLKQVVGVPSELLEAERTAEVNIANYEMKLSETDDPSEIGLIKDSLFAARREKEALEYRIKTTFPAYADALYSWQATTKLEDVQNDLPDHAALITYFLGDHSFCTFLIAKDTFWMQEKPLPEEFITVLADFHHSISDWQYANDSSAVSGNVFLKNSHVLYQWLLQEPLAFTPAKRLFIVPDGRLGSMPFELLLTQAYQGSWIDRDVPFLLKERTVSYRFSARKNAQFNKNEGAYGWGGFGLEGDDATLSALNQPAGYTGLRNLGPLPFADDEVLAVHNLLGGAFWLNQEATRENFVQNAEKFGILHLATHGVVDEQNALRTRLLFHQSSTGADPFVYAADLYNLQLTAGLSVLSACGSGTGSWQKGEGVMSLARAFAFAGCPSIVMSLWNISDQSTSDLMVDFYKHLKAGVEKDEALRLAKLEYLKRVSPEYAKPIYWAAFVPIGEMDALPSAYFPVTRPWWWYGGLIGLSVFVLWVLYRRLKPSGTP